MFTENAARRLLQNFACLICPFSFWNFPLSTISIDGNGEYPFGAYLTALADFPISRYALSVPRLSVDMAEASLSVPLIKLGSEPITPY